MLITFPLYHYMVEGLQRCVASLPPHMGKFMFPPTQSVSILFFFLIFPAECHERKSWLSCIYKEQNDVGQNIWNGMYDSMQVICLFI